MKIFCRTLLAIALTVSGCDQQATPTERNPTIDVALPEAPTAPDRQAPVAVPDRPAPTVAVAELAVDGEGLRLVDPANGRTTPLPFGMAEAQLIAVLQRLRGTPDRGINGECGAGPLGYANWADGLSLLMKDGKFVGWAVDGRSAGAITTMAGIGPGSSRTMVTDAMSATFSKTTLGTEFQAGALGGLLDGAGARSKITNMWAGVTCLFR